jgi:hypothetical protein
MLNWRDKPAPPRKGGVEPPQFEKGQVHDMPGFCVVRHCGAFVLSVTICLLDEM